MAERYKDSPWAFVSERPEKPGASRPIPGDLPAIKAGERLSINDPQHRTKGARKGKTYQSSGRPRGWGEATTDEMMIMAKGLNSRQRRELRRKLEGKGKYAPKPKVAAPLKDKPMRPNPASRGDYTDMIHDAMHRCEVSEAHTDFHAKRGLGIGEDCK